MAGISVGSGCGVGCLDGMLDGVLLNLLFIFGHLIFTFKKNYFLASFMGGGILSRLVYLF